MLALLAYVHFLSYLCKVLCIMLNLNQNITIAKQGLLSLLLLVLMVSCKPAPQQVRHLSDDRKPDSLMMLQLEFNQRLIEIANQECWNYVKQRDNNTYAQDEFGFWYSKTIKTDGDSLASGQMATLHIQIYELNDSLVADVKERMNVLGSELPLAINRSLSMMRMGEEMQIISPWYTAYGVEGTSLVQGYTNVKIVLKVEN